MTPASWVHGVEKVLPRVSETCRRDVGNKERSGAEREMRSRGGNEQREIRCMEGRSNDVGMAILSFFGLATEFVHELKKECRQHQHKALIDHITSQTHLPPVVVMPMHQQQPNQVPEGSY